MAIDSLRAGRKVNPRFATNTFEFVLPFLVVCNFALIPQVTGFKERRASNYKLSAPLQLRGACMKSLSNAATPLLPLPSAHTHRDGERGMRARDLGSCSTSLSEPLVLSSLEEGREGGGGVGGFASALALDSLCNSNPKPRFCLLAGDDAHRTLRGLDARSQAAKRKGPPQGGTRREAAEPWTDECTEQI